MASQGGREGGAGIVPYGNKGGLDGEHSGSSSQSGASGRHRSEAVAGGERFLDEDSILNGWVKRYYALQQQVCEAFRMLFTFFLMPHPSSSFNSIRASRT
jgi:hypothetical protein